MKSTVELHVRAPQPLVIAHRGARGHAPENTLTSAELGHSVGADLWELDVNYTRDYKMVVVHDDTLVRTTNVEEVYPGRNSYRVCDFTLEELSRLDAGSWYEGRDQFGRVAAGELSAGTLASFKGLRIHTVPTLHFEVDESVMRGFEMAINVDTANDSYRQGMMLGAQLIEMVKGLKEQNQVQLNTYLLVAEFKRAFMSDSTVNLMMLQGNVNMLMQAEMRAVKERDPQAIENAEAGKKFIEDLVKNDPDVVVTESGLAYKVVKPGNGKKFAESDRIMTRYKGSKIDGTVFDQTKDKETRFDGRSPKIGPNELLIFEVETVGVEPAKKK